MGAYEDRKRIRLSFQRSNICCSCFLSVSSVGTYWRCARGEFISTATDANVLSVRSFLAAFCVFGVKRLVGSWRDMCPVPSLLEAPAGSELPKLPPPPPAADGSMGSGTLLRASSLVSPLVLLLLSQCLYLTEKMESTRKNTLLFYSIRSIPPASGPSPLDYSDHWGPSPCPGALAP